MARKYEAVKFNFAESFERTVARYENLDAGKKADYERMMKYTKLSEKADGRPHDQEPASRTKSNASSDT